MDRVDILKLLDVVLQEEEIATVRKAREMLLLPVIYVFLLEKLVVR